MVREIWYRHLAIADRLIVEARDCIDSQKQHVSALEQDGEDTSRAAALLNLLEETLHLMYRHRATILEKVAAYKSLELSKGTDERGDELEERPDHRLPGGGLEGAWRPRCEVCCKAPPGSPQRPFPDGAERVALNRKYGTRASAPAEALGQAQILAEKYPDKP